MNNRQLAELINDHTDLSMSEILDKLKLMDADQLINLTASVMDEDWDLMQELLDDVQEPQDESESTVIELRDQIKKMGKQVLNDEADITEVWQLIGDLTEEDWKLVSAQLDEDLLKLLYKDVTDQDVDTVSAEVNQKIYDHAQTYVAESIMVYDNQMCEVRIPQAPEGLVGITVNEQFMFVNRRQLHSLNEHVMGMTHMPVLSRVLELAGMGPANTSDHAIRPPVEQPAQVLDHTQELRRHIHQIEELLNSPDPTDVQAEIHLHAQELSRKAHRLADKFKRD
mgnify:CR=1 FL=1